ncbi:MAG: leucine-rich repeat domain-containing protein [Paludibacteraceae bacterium]|nr:leucine-rich repeat domain-containing protein [Paludibacteraceae bacterium]
MRKSFTFFFALAISANFTQAEVFKGECFDLLTWSLNTEDSTLIITGSGAMANTSYRSAPWYDYRSYIVYLSLPDGLTSIGNYAFADCNRLTFVTIPNSVTSIGEWAFSDCYRLTSVTIPNSVNFLGKNVFAGCRSLTSVVIPDSVTSIGDGAFQNCSSFISIEIPNRVTAIGNFVFHGCASLISIDIPNSVTSIGVSAFQDCSYLTSIEIPSNITSIGERAFEGCSSLASITNNTIIPQGIDSNVFGGNAVNLAVDKSACTLYVPTESVDAYSTTSVWKDFTNIVGIDISKETPDIPSSAPSVYTTPTNPAQKLIKDGNMYILSEDKTYTITGKAVK